MEQLLSTKLHIPSSPHGLVLRERLFRKLEEGVRGKLILVSAPAGFGKTTQIAEWARERSESDFVSWVHLDKNDNDLIRFLGYLIAALQIHQSDIGEAALAGLQSMPPAPAEAVMTSLINDLDAIDRELILVLDDYHLIESPAIHETVGSLLEYLPDQVCLVIGTRSDPPLSLHRMRAGGLITEIRVDDLRFTLDESKSLLEAGLKTSITADDVATLDARLEGWAAGLQMVTLSLQGRGNVAQFINSFSDSHRYIMDYLSEEIFNQQPQPIQQFLLKTSVLDRLCGSLCDFVVGPEFFAEVDKKEFAGGQEILEYLERSNLFLLPLDDERHWYRYHHLFANLLQQRLRRFLPEEISEIQHKASNWFAENGYFDEAFRYSIEGDDIQAAADIVESQGLQLLKQGSLSTIFSWFSQLPSEMVEVTPRLSVIYAWTVLLATETVDVEPYLAAAEASPLPLDDADELLGEIAAIRAYAAARREDVNTTIEQAQVALELLPEDDYSVRSVVSFVLGGVYFLQGDLPNALEAMTDSSLNGEKSGNIHVAVSALSFLANAQMAQGLFVDAEETSLRALKLGSSPRGRPLPITASVFAGLGQIYLARQDLPRSRDFASKGLELGEQWLNTDSQINCLLVLTQIAHLEGNGVEAREKLQQARQLANTHTLTPGTEASIERVEHMILSGRMREHAQSIFVEPLSDRELEVLGLMAEGRTNMEISNELIIAPGTVKAHSSSIYRKLDVRNRTEAVARAREFGLL